MRFLIPLMFLLGLAAPAAVAQNIPGASFPVHGNWCGFGHSGNAFYGPPPVDLLDQSCQQHDLCTTGMGRFNCGCDIVFMLDLRAKQWPHPAMQGKARAIYDAMAMMPCSDPQGQAVKMEMAMSDWMSDISSGREEPWEIMLRLGYLGLHGLERTLREGGGP